ncbi:MAG: (d)CMP kinase [Eubacteriales bacterium]|nr:(d)CMP kinase [Eubacteriales bacterium]
MKSLTIAIDGPSGAGKSTSARALAQRLQLAHLDTGAMYRALAVALLADGWDPACEEEVLDHLADYDLTVEFAGPEQRTLVNGVDRTGDLYSSAASRGASDVSRYSQVRSYLVDKQRKLAQSQSFILDGRDIGTVVLPDADIKFFLTASPATRASRRWQELQAKGENLSLAEVLANIEARDYQDSHRADSPLKCAADAHLIDSSQLSFDQVLDLMLQLMRDQGLEVE